MHVLVIYISNSSLQITLQQQNPNGVQMFRDISDLHYNGGENDSICAQELTNIFKRFNINTTFQCSVYSG